MADDPGKILHLAGWTSEEITLLINEGICPDHWTSNPIPTFALLEVIRCAIDASETSYRQGLPPIFTSLGLKQPKNLTGVITKVKRYVTKAEKTNNYLPLIQEMKELSKTAVDIIGPACSKIGITPEWLNNSNTCTDTITNNVVVELQQYRNKKGITWKTVHDEWWPKLFPKTFVPNIQTIQQNWDLLAEKKTTVSRNYTKDEKEKFLQKAYVLAKSGPPKQVNVSANDEPEHELPDDGIDSGYCSSSDNDVTIRRMLRSHGDTMIILHELLEAERCEKESLKSELDKEKKLRLAAENDVQLAQQALKKSKSEKHVLINEHQKQRSKYQAEKIKAQKISAELQREIVKLTSSNVVRRLKTQTANYEKEKEKTEQLKVEIEALKEELIQLSIKQVKKTRENKNKTEQLRYHRLKRSEQQVTADEENRFLRSQLQDLERKNDQLKSDLDEIMSDKQIETFESGQFKSDIRVTCYELISRGVGSRHVSDIIRFVLKHVAGISCGRLPKPTLIRMMALEQALLAKESAKSAMDSSSTPITLQVDGTSKRHVPFLTSLVTTDSGTYGIGLSEIGSETSETVLAEVIAAVEELISVDSADELNVNQLLLKLKNTMTDRCVVNKKFVKLLETWREKTLPKVVANWENLSDETKANMSSVNDLYCGMHLILNFQDYTGAALKEWEQVEANGGKLGREKHLLWTRKESATFLSIRSTCEAFGPDANAQAGSPREFNEFLEQKGEKNYLKAYRGNRFNIPFYNGAAVYYHHYHSHIKDTIASLPVHKQNNQLSRSVLFDLQDPIIIGGIRAMGIINCNITQPLIRMIQDPNISVMQASKYYSQLHTSVSSWMVDPQPLLDDSALLFEDFVAPRDNLHKTLYETVDEDVEFNTKQALSIALHNIYVCIVRQLEDHLPGGKFHDVSQDSNISSETKSCPKDNVAAERIFAGLDFLKRKSPNISALAMQGILMWSENNTRKFLEHCSESERERLIWKAVKNRKTIQRKYQEKVKSIKVKRQQDVEERKKLQEEKERKLVSSTVTNTDHVMKLCGAICKTAGDVDDLVLRKQNSGDQVVREALLSQIKYYKCINRGFVKGSLFFVSTGGQAFSIPELQNRLKEIISKIDRPVVDDPEKANNEVEKQQERDALREKLLSKLPNSLKRKCPFPDEIVNKRVRHICLDPSGEKLTTYKGRVVRESTQGDIEELMEDMYRPYLSKGYKFYTVIYDPPYDQLFCYPLKKEWDDGLLSIM